MVTPRISSAGSSARTALLHRRLADAEALTALAEQLVGAPHARAAAQALLTTGAQATGCDRGVVLAGPDGQLPVLASQGPDVPVPRRPDRPSALLGEVLATGAAQVVGVDAQAADPRGGTAP